MNSTVGYLILSMIQLGFIRFQSYSHCYGQIDVEVTSDVFTDKSFFISVYEDEWNNGPDRSVASALSDLATSGNIKFTSDFGGMESAI